MDGFMHILFVCSQAKLRSKTANDTAWGYTYTTDYCGTDSDADRPVTREALEKADVIVCMQSEHRKKLRKKYKEFTDKMQTWGIPDIYAYGKDELIVILRGKFEKLIEKV